MDFAYKIVFDDTTQENSNTKCYLFDSMKPAFIDILKLIVDAVNTQNWKMLIENVLNLSHFFLQKDVEEFTHCQELLGSEIGQYFLRKIDDPEFTAISPAILELLINMTYAEDNSRSFAIFNFNNRGLEIINHLKSILEPDFLPLVYAYAYNIYSVCHEISKNKAHIDLPLWKETFLLEDYCYDLKKFKMLDFHFLIPMAMMNILRDEISEEAKFPSQNFFDGLMPIAMNPDPIIAKYSLWCLYFAFKNSYSVLLPHMPKEMSNILNEKILRMLDPDEVKISLFIYCYCLIDCAPITIKKHFLNEIPIEFVLQLAIHDDEELSRLAIVVCNDYIACDTFNRMNFCLANFNGFIHLAQAGAASSKIEAGFLLITTISCSDKENQPNFFTPEVVEILCDLLQIHNYEFNFILANFLLKMFPLYPCMVEFLISIDFPSEVQYLIDSSTNHVYTDLLRRLLMKFDDASSIKE